MIIGIIGNGFDIAHNIELKFKDFIESDIFNKEIGIYKKYFTNEKYCEFCSRTELWSRFEDYLSLVYLENKIQHNRLHILFLPLITKTLYLFK